MTAQKEDLGLSLSLSFPHNAPTPLHLNLLSTPTYSSSPSSHNPHKPSWNDPFASSGLYNTIPKPSILCLLFLSGSAPIFFSFTLTTYLSTILSHFSSFTFSTTFTILHSFSPLSMLIQSFLIFPTPLSISPLSSSSISGYPKRCPFCACR